MPGMSQFKEWAELIGAIVFAVVVVSALVAKFAQPTIEEAMRYYDDPEYRVEEPTDG